MPLQGKAFITMWHDVDPSAVDEWTAWHTHEHMAERVGIPGFLGGRRYWNEALPRQRCFTLYEGETAEVFRSVGYLARLNAPTPWTAKVAPSFRNFLRIACDTLASEGDGLGGAIATWRLNLAAGAAPDTAAIVGALRARRPVTAAHVAIARPDITAYRTTESSLRPAGEGAGFDALVLAEGVGQAALAGVVPELTASLRRLAGVTAVQESLYDLSYRLAASELG
jgi:hypothetical protein